MDPLMSCDRIQVHIRKHICKCKYLDMNIMKSNATYKKTALPPRRDWSCSFCCGDKTAGKNTD